MAIELRKYRDIKLILYGFFLLIPVIFWANNGFVILQSISAYVTEIPVTFGGVLFLVGGLFFIEGYINRTNYFEMIIGAAMFLLVIFDMNKYELTHYTFATIFFEGTVFNMIYFSSGKYRIFSILFGIAINFAMAGCFFFGWYSIFWAEWIGMLPISLHKILETLKIID